MEIDDPCRQDCFVTMLNSSGEIRKIGVILIGPGGSTPGGVASVVDLQVGAKCLDAKVCTRFIRSTGNRPPAAWGKITITNIIFFLRTVAILFWSLLTWRRGELCHIHTSYGLSFYKNLFFVLICNLFCKPAILHIHSGRIGTNFQTKSKTISAVTKWLLCRCRVIIVLNMQTFKVVANAGFPKDRIYLTPNAVALPEYAKERNEIPALSAMLRSRGFFSCLTVGGGLSWQKGIIDLLKVARLARDAGKRIAFIVVGIWADKEEMRQTLRQVNEMNLQNRLFFTGGLPRHKVAQFYRQADVYVLLSYHEGMPISILEAMSAGCPVISTPVGGIPQQIHHEENGFLVPVGDTQAAFSAISTLCDDRKLATVMGKKNIEKVSLQYGIARYADDLYSAYRAALS